MESSHVYVNSHGVFPGRQNLHKKWNQPQKWNQLKKQNQHKAELAQYMKPAQRWKQHMDT